MDRYTLLHRKTVELPPFYTMLDSTQLLPNIPKKANRQHCSFKSSFLILDHNPKNRKFTSTYVNACYLHTAGTRTKQRPKQFRTRKYPMTTHKTPVVTYSEMCHSSQICMQSFTHFSLTRHHPPEQSGPLLPVCMQLHYYPKGQFTC